MTISTNDRVEAVLGRVLGAGSAASTVLLALGLLLTIAGPEAAATGALVRAGLIILMITPMARVLAATVAYARSREWSSALMAGTVLLVLFGSVAVALQR
jgi:uncharacterized membrane protein